MNEWNFRQETNGETKRLVLDLQSDDRLDNFALNMLAHNETVHIIPVQLMRVNDANQLHFQITDMEPMKDRLKGGIPKKRVLMILNSVLNAFEETEEYMLDQNKVYLNEDYIYLDGQDECRVIYIPLERIEEMDVLLFMKRMVERIQPDCTEKDPYLYDILNAFNRGGIRRLSDLRELLRKHENAGRQKDRRETPVISAEISGSNSLSESDNRGKTAEEHMKQKEKKEKQKEKKQASAAEKKSVFKDKAIFSVTNKKKPAAPAKIPIMNIPGRQEPVRESVSFAEKNPKREVNAEQKEIPAEKEAASQLSGQEVPVAETGEIYESYEETVMMQESEFEKELYTVCLKQPGEMQLIRNRDDSTYVLVDGDNSFGSGENVRHRILGNKAVSRDHASIYRRGNSCWLIDHGSTNGTFLNDRRLEEGKREEMGDGSLVRFADEEFVFRLR